MRAPHPAFFLLALAATAHPTAARQGTDNPHGALPPGLDCESCHTAAGWTPLREPLSFTHGEASGFDLTGAHRDTRCAGCHLDLRFDAPRIQPLECGACHADPHQGRLVDSCAACHDTRTFSDVDGELTHARTVLPLTGAHLQLPCENCHVEDRVAFTGLDPECISCHRDAYESAAVVDHTEFSTDCTRCHSDLGWSDSPLFDHVEASGGWPLVQVHAWVRCDGCHQVPGMAPIYSAASPDDCYACHADEYQEEHGDGFSTTCADCHHQRSWGDATFDHSAVGAFSLLGAHARIDCRACHSVPGYGLLFPAPAGQEDCVACHQRDYDREHGGDGFPTTCSLCHSVENWEASFRHDSQFFPIFSGRHAGQWSSCAECHTVPDDFRTFSCIDCHAHGQADTDQQHREVNDYVYASAGCYACHPTGTEG